MIESRDRSDLERYTQICQTKFWQEIFRLEIAYIFEHVKQGEEMPFSTNSFDTVIYVASLQFIENYKKAIDRTTDILRPNGLLILMLLNTESEFVKEKMKNPDSYMSKIKHKDLEKIQVVVEDKYDIETEYRIGVEGENIFESRDRTNAVLYVIKGIRRR